MSKFFVFFVAVAVAFAVTAAVAIDDAVAVAIAIAFTVDVTISVTLTVAFTDSYIQQSSVLLTKICPHRVITWAQRSKQVEGNMLRIPPIIRFAW